MNQQRIYFNCSKKWIIWAIGCPVTLLAFITGLIMITQIDGERNPDYPYLGEIIKVSCHFIDDLYCNTTYTISYTVDNDDLISTYTQIVYEFCNGIDSSGDSDKNNTCFELLDTKYVWLDCNPNDYKHIYNIQFITDKNYFLYAWLGPLLTFLSTISYILLFILTMTIIMAANRNRHNRQGNMYDELS